MSPEYCFAVHSAPVLFRTNVKTPMVMLSVVKAKTLIGC